ncbi:hypothetical protein V2J09_008279 [Rumex salicifolius]
MAKHHLHTLSLVILFTVLTCTEAAAAENTTKEFLDVHNAARAAVGVAPLTWNDTLAAFASGFASRVKVHCDNSLRSHGPYGENTASGYDAFTVGGAVNVWVGQKNYYRHGNNTCGLGSGGCKAYTQVVWRNTGRVGCASVVCGAGWPFVVCEYDPPGNVPGEKPY